MVLVFSKIRFPSYMLELKVVLEEELYRDAYLTNQLPDILGIFYGQADRKGGGGSATSALTLSKCENFDPFFSIEYDSGRLF